MKNLEFMIVLLVIIFLFLLVIMNIGISKNFDRSSIFPSHDKTLVINGTVK